MSFWRFTWQNVKYNFRGPLKGKISVIWKINLIYSFNQYLLSAHDVFSTVLSAGLI